MSGHEDEREARKHGTDTPGEPTDEFVVYAFAEGARALWPDSRDPGWHVTFNRWLAARDARVAATARADALREAADNMPLNDIDQPWYATAVWLRRRASLLRAATEDPLPDG
jgi:hypothetical protein